MEFMPYKVGQLWDAVVEAIVEEILYGEKKKQVLVINLLISTKIRHAIPSL